MRNEKACVPDPNCFVSNPGDEFEFEYAPKVMPDGTVQLKVSGKFNVQDRINSFRESTDMSYIIAQMKIGNLDVLSQVAPVYGDFTQFPKTYAEMLQLRIDSEKSFYQLDPEVRKKFDNDFNQYFATAGTNEWFEKLGISNEQGSAIKEEVIDNES